MKLQGLLSLLFGLSCVSLSGLAGCALTPADAGGDGQDEEIVEETEDAVTGAPSNFGYFVVTRRDFRKCAAPLCGGFFVKRVNAPETRCADGTLQAECYVSSISYRGIGLSAREEQELHAAVSGGQALVKARQYKTKWNGGALGTLEASEGWLPATGSIDPNFDGTFYRAADNGIRCIKAPCPSTTASPLNGVSDPHNVIAVHLDSTEKPADEATTDRVMQALMTKEGILVAGGVAIPKCIPGSSCGAFLSASEFYLPLTRREGQGCGFWQGYGCNAGQYCAWTPGDICGAADAGGTCQYKPEGCAQIYAPVCACDGKTYSNACMAAAAGYSVSSDGACAQAN